ncbi:vacuolar membrane protein-domain-containing protein [Phellopilus nigrolimitatus]|nr:vacuolar membrane protein-domain-containing protein [Phellopilus nigrolimitatus]
MTDPLDTAIPPSFFDEEFPVDERKCRLLGPTALVVQALMGVFVILSLVFKRNREKPKRPWKIWMFDVSKQIAGQMFVHGVNVLISDLGAHHASGNPCALYFLNILIDTTLGVGIIYFIHHLLTHLFSNKLHLKGFESGQYGDPPSMLYWARQAAVYVTSLTTMKVLVIGLFAVWPGIFKFGDWLLSWTGGGDAMQVIFVMGLFPIVMNVLQFWLIDSIVKSSATNDVDCLPNSTPRDSADREPLFSATGSDDGDEEETSTRGYDTENPIPPSRSQPQSISSLNPSTDEQKYLSSRTSLEETEEQDEHAYPPPQSFSYSSLSIPKHRHRKRSPPPPLQLRPQPKPIDPSGVHVIAVAGTPLTGQITANPAQKAQINSPSMNEKLSPNNRGDWDVSWD